MGKRVAIVGGGVTGLAAAFQLERIGDATIDLYEAASRLGGKIQTTRVGGFQVESGPDAFFARKPGAIETIRDLGLEDAVIAPKQKEFRMLVGGRLYRVPGGLVTLTYSGPCAVEEAEFLSPEAKARVLAERHQPPGSSPDESIRSFFTRRFGAEFTRLVAEPLLAGTHGGDGDRLSMRALYPGYFNLERTQGSLVGIGAPKPVTPAAPSPSFLSFRGGMTELIERLRAQLRRTRIHLSSPVRSLDDIDADAILLAIPANHAAPLLAPSAPRAAERLAAIEHRSSAIATFAYRREQVDDPLAGTGFLVPASEHAPISGCTWSSEKWPHRAPGDTVLLRVFLGERSVEAEDEAMIETAIGAIAPLLGIRGAPIFSAVTRWLHALPQYLVGHLDLVADIERLLSDEAPHVTIAGTSYRGVGVPDCLRQGREAAARMAEIL